MLGKTVYGKAAILGGVTYISPTDALPWTRWYDYERLQLSWLTLVVCFGPVEKRNVAPQRVLATVSKQSRCQAWNTLLFIRIVITCFR